jgi:adenine-specific DNA methylase
MDLNFTPEHEWMPDFTSHEEAREWFKELFDDRFLLRMSDLKDDQRIYYYHLVKDPEVYQHYMESFSRPDHEITNMHVFKSYSTIEISENGDVHFIV